MPRALIVLLCLACSLPSYALTRSEIRQEIRYDIRDTTDTVNINNRFPDDILNSRINIVQDKIAAYTKCLRGRCLVTPVAETQEYRLPTDCVKVDRVAFINTSGSTTTYRRLEGRTLEGLDRDHFAWESRTSGLPQRYYVRRNLIGLDPKPSSTYAQSQSLKIDYFKKPTALDSDDDEPFDGDYSLRQYHDLVILGVVIMCKHSMGESFVDDMALYKDGLDRMKDAVKFNSDLQENISVSR